MYFGAVAIDILSLLNLSVTFPMMVGKLSLSLSLVTIPSLYFSLCFYSSFSLFSILSLFLSFLMSLFLTPFLLLFSPSHSFFLSFHSLSAHTSTCSYALVSLSLPSVFLFFLSLLLSLFIFFSFPLSIFSSLFAYVFFFLFFSCPLTPSLPLLLFLPPSRSSLSVLSILLHN